MDIIIFYSNYLKIVIKRCPFSIDKVYWALNYSYIRFIYDKIDFDSDETTHINRH